MLSRLFLLTTCVRSLDGWSSTFHGSTMRIRLRSFARATIFTSTPITMMPEGPEVRTLVDQLQGGVGMRLLNISFVSGRYVKNGPPDSFDAFCKTMTTFDPPTNKTEMINRHVDSIQEWNAKGKFIYIVLDDGCQTQESRNNAFKRSIWITLGMSGRFLSEKSLESGSMHQRHIRWYLQLYDVGTNKMHKIYYHDARNFGTVKFCLSAEDLKKKLSSLGPDMLSPDTTEYEFLEVVKRQKPTLNVCKFLMDQSKISGVGNYILAEGLYKASIDPFASLKELDDLHLRYLYRQLRGTAMTSYEAQGLSRKGGSYRDTDGNRGKFEFELQCYGRERCAKGKKVVREKDGPHGRTIWYTQEQLFMPRSRRAAINDKEVDDGIVPQQTGSTADNGALSSEENAVASLVAGLKEDSWRNALSNFTSSESFKKLAMFIASEHAAHETIYPPKDEVFSALNLCPLEDVKVVIVGQDPYHGPGQGHGLAFSVRKGVMAPPSLQNIFKEAMDDVGIDPPPHGSLVSWAEQGVLLLNTVLTVRKGEANSHSRKGWEEFTDKVIEILLERESPIVFLLWGGPAQKKAKKIDGHRHIVIKTSHPSPLGCRKSSSPFMGSNCFSRANKGLVEANLMPIDWNVT